MFDECVVFRVKRNIARRGKTLLWLVLLCSVILCGCGKEDYRNEEPTRETPAVIQPAQAVPETESPAVCVVGLGCTLQIYDEDMTPHQNVKVIVETANGQTMLIAQFSETKQDCSLPHEEGDYQVTLVNMAEPIRRVVFPIQVRLGQADTLCVYTDESGALVPSVPEEKQIPSGGEKIRLRPAGPAVYTETMADNSDHTLNEKNHWNAFVQCYYPVLSGGEAEERINADLERIVEAFLTAFSEEEIHEPHYAYGMVYHYTHTASIRVCHNGDGLISFFLSYSTFWGEDRKYSGQKGYVYDLTTGERLTLCQLTGFSDEVLADLKLETVRSHIRQRNLQTELAGALDPDTVSFVVTDGQIGLVVEGPFRDYGNPFSQPILTDWFVEVEPGNAAGSYREPAYAERYASTP